MAGEEQGGGMPAIGRREMLGVTGVAVCGVALAGCGTSDGSAKAVVPPGIKGKVIAKKADVPVGSGKVIQEWKIVITQPTSGVFKAFTARCPHRGCSVNRPQDGVMTCPCHGSEFAADTGKCLKGPATGPLAEFAVKVEGDGIVIL
ncbi:Rieske (2Fe-2S) protein [Nonomuraea sp. NPDC003804]|uniref:Rieske (2Fe-2S) protein n=1 Tax=Nonomuraea sp. NPDC003804 TaxID=3154547 RepID=UPI0033A9E3EB